MTEYYHSFQTEYDTNGMLHGWPPPDLQLDDGVQFSAAGKSDADTQAAIHQREIATCFILSADRAHFGKLQHDLQDNFARGTNQFPTTLTSAYNLLLTTEAALGTATNTDTLDEHGGHGRRQHGAHRKNNNNTTGNQGNKQGSPVNPAGHTGLYTSLCFPRGAILLDTGATASIIHDQDLLTDISTREPPLTILTDGGYTPADKAGSITVYNSLWLSGMRPTRLGTSSPSVTCVAFVGSHWIQRHKRFFWCIY